MKKHLMLAGALCLLAAVPAWAASVGVDDTVYQVHRVSANDVLNLRAGPGVRHKIITQLPANGRGVVAMGEEQIVGRSTWIKIAWAGKQGWVNKRYLQAIRLGANGRPVGADVMLKCLGTEPFWKLDISERKMTVAMPHGPKYEVAVDFRQQSANNRSIAVVAAHRGNAQTTAFLQKVERCSDGMSNKMYPYSVSAVLNSYKVVSGCCSLSNAN